MDSPDWQNIITLVSGGGVSDAPDWQTVVTGPGGTQPVVSGTGASFLQPIINGGNLGCTMNPYFGQGGASLLGGSHYVMPFAAGFTGTVNNVVIPVTSGTALTSTTTFAGIYDWGETTAGTMTLLCSSASGVAATAWASSGLHPVAMSTHPTLTAGKTYAIAAQIGGATLPCAGTTLGTITTGPPAQYPWGLNVTFGGTSLPATITFASGSISQRLFLGFVD